MSSLSRFQFIDIFRGCAVFFMIETIFPYIKDRGLVFRYETQDSLIQIKSLFLYCMQINCFLCKHAQLDLQKSDTFQSMQMQSLDTDDNKNLGKTMKHKHSIATLQLILEVDNL